MKSAIVIIFFIVIFPGFSFSQEWKPLFNAKDLKNWQQLGGEAQYKTVDEAIVGTSKAGTPNSFLATKKVYDDLILEFEAWVDPALNSGVQIRSNSFKEYRNGRIHGYQVELDPSDRAYTGGICDEARRGWLYPLSVNEKGRGAFRNGSWNKVRVEAIGNEIRTWVNQTQCANLVDDMTDKGFIALQVHSRKPEQVGKEVKWKT